MSTPNRIGFMKFIKRLFVPPPMVQESIKGETVKCGYCGLYHQTSQTCPQQTMVEAIKSGRIPKILPVPAPAGKIKP